MSTGDATILSKSGIAELLEGVRPVSTDHSTDAAGSPCLLVAYVSTRSKTMYTNGFLCLLYGSVRLIRSSHLRRW